MIKCLLIRARDVNQNIKYLQLVKYIRPTMKKKLKRLYTNKKPKKRKYQTTLFNILNINH